MALSSQIGVFLYPFVLLLVSSAEIKPCVYILFKRKIKSQEFFSGRSTVLGAMAFACKSTLLVQNQSGS